MRLYIIASSSKRRTSSSCHSSKVKFPSESATLRTGVAVGDLWHLRALSGLQLVSTGELYSPLHIRDCRQWDLLYLSTAYKYKVMTVLYKVSLLTIARPQIKSQIQGSYLVCAVFAVALHQKVLRWIPNWLVRLNCRFHKQKCFVHLGVDRTRENLQAELCRTWM